MPQSSIKNRQNPKNDATGCITFHSAAELDQLGEVTSGASLDLVQLGRGRLHGELAHLDLGLSSVHYNSFSLPVQGRGPVSADRWTFVVFPPRVSGMFNGIELTPSKILLFHPGSEFDGTTHHKSHQDWNFTVEDSALCEVIQRLFQKDMPNVNSSCVELYPDQSVVRSLRTFARDSLALSLASDQLLMDSCLRASLHDELTEQLARVVMCVQLNNRAKRRVASHSRIVRISEEYLRSQLQASISVAKLCKVADVSERTLRNAYQSVLGLSPNLYIKARRLQMARRQLKHAASTATVARAALSSGFSHLGQFSKDYLDFFGESPSQTLAASKKVKLLAGAENVIDRPARWYSTHLRHGLTRPTSVLPTTTRSMTLWG